MQRSAWMLLSLLAGCGADRDAFLTVFDPCVPLVLEPASEADELQLGSVEDAIAMWRAVGDVRLTLASDDPSAATLPIVFEESYIFLGWYDDREQVVRLATRVDERRALAVVLAHELGHAFNLYHVEGRPSVMNKGNTTIEPLATDARALEAEWGTCN